ncbi:glucose-1-phosphate thymidylyltransferase, partial [Sulfolobus sp. F3]
NVSVEGGVYLMDSLIGSNVTIKRGNRWQKLIVGENSWLTL